MQRIRGSGDAGGGVAPIAVEHVVLSELKERRNV